MWMNFSHDKLLNINWLILQWTQSSTMPGFYFGEGWSFLLPSFIIGINNWNAINVLITGYIKIFPIPIKCRCIWYAIKGTVVITGPTKTMVRMTVLLNQL